MPNIAKLLKDEIQRIARREIKAATADLRKDNAALKRALADHKRRLALLERGGKRIRRELEKSRPALPPAPQEEVSKSRITGKMIRSIRQKLGVSQVNFAKLVGVSGQSVYQWERKPGRLAFRGEAKAAIVRARKMTKAEAMKRLEEA